MEGKCVIRVSPGEWALATLVSPWGVPAWSSQPLSSLTPGRSRWCWWTYMQGSSGDSDTEKRRVDTVREGEGWTGWDSSAETDASPRVPQAASRDLLHDAGSQSPGLCDNLEGWDGMDGGMEVREGGDMCTPMADSCWCMAETNPFVQSGYPPIKNKFKEDIKIWIKLYNIKKRTSSKSTTSSNRVKRNSRAHGFLFLSQVARGVLAPQSGIRPLPPALEAQSLTTRPPGKSKDLLFCLWSSM